MSGTAATCCPPSSLVDTYIPCPRACQFATLQCSDLISASIQAILDLGEVKGSTASDILTKIQELCAETVTLEDVQLALDTGAKRGIFIRVFSSIHDDPTFMIVARMAVFNYKNRAYSRWPCRTGSFWVK
jgi:hypothetical protein